ncbi:MAG: cupin domain-containing protein [Opitutaceae bacterium]|nr:cupin domain-containing protein [Opitutaceae bacterium]
MHEAEKIIVELGLQPLPGEGGFFRQIWIAPLRPGETRSATSIIHYLMTRESFSALHRLAMRETWRFQAGDPVRLMQLGGPAGFEAVILGANTARGEQPQAVVPAGVWQGAHLAEGASRGWALLNCAVEPAWDERDFELGERAALQREFPAAADEITRLTRDAF